MAAKRTAQQQQSVDRNKEIGNFVHHFYKNIVGVQPDASQYAAGNKILDSLMNNPDERLRSYTCAELSVAAAYMKHKGLKLFSLSLFHYPGLVSAILNGQTEVADKIIDKLIGDQQRDGIYCDEWIERNRPQGW